MKKLPITILTAVLLAAMTFSAAAQTKVATVNMKTLFNGYYKTKLAQTSLQNRKDELRKEIKQMADGLTKAQKEYKKMLSDANDPAISTAERTKRKAALAAKAKEIKSSQQAIQQFQQQAESQLSDQSQRMSGNLVSEIQQAVASEAKSDGYSIVLNSADVETVVYADNSHDITSAVLKQLNAGAPIDVNAPATSATSSSPLNINTNL